MADKVLLAWSGGKDCALACVNCRRRPIRDGCPADDLRE
jgi:hypothetical protein